MRRPAGKGITGAREGAREVERSMRVKNRVFALAVFFLRPDISPYKGIRIDGVSLN